MSLLAFFTYEEGRFTKVPSSELKKINNPGADCTVDRICVIHKDNTTFTLEQIQEIIEFVKAIKKLNSQIKID
jgi:hypothetical protein